MIVSRLGLNQPLDTCALPVDLIEEGAHTPYHPKMTHALILATDHFANQ